MRTIRTHFLYKNIRTDIVVTLVEDKTFAVDLESTDVFDDNLNLKQSETTSATAPGMIIQKTRSNEWLVLQPGDWDLNHKEVQTLGRAIESSFNHPL